MQICIFGLALVWQTRWFFSFKRARASDVCWVDIRVLLPVLLVLADTMTMMKMMAWCSYDDAAANQYCMLTHLLSPTIRHKRRLISCMLFHYPACQRSGKAGYCYWHCPSVCLHSN